MAVNLFPAAVILSVTGSVGYILLKLLAAVSGNHLSQSWRYHGIVAVSLLFVLPVYKRHLTTATWPSGSMTS